MLFNGNDGFEWPAKIAAIGRDAVEVRVGDAMPVDRELRSAVTIAVGVPANDRMDGLTEKACELGAMAIQPLICDRSVFRVQGERAEAKRRHWQGIAAAASEQCGRTRVAQVRPVQSLPTWLGGLDPGASRAERRGLAESDSSSAQPSIRIVLSFAADAMPLANAIGGADREAAAGIVVLSGPEGGLTSEEEAAAVGRGFVRASLGPRVLRADTAPLAALAWLGVSATRRG